MGIAYPVLIDASFELWQDYENEGWPARYLFDGRARLFDYHHGEGAYAETELAIQELLGRRARAARRRCAPRTRPGARLLRPDRGSAGRLLAAPTRPAGCGRCSTARGAVRVDAGAARAAVELAVTHPAPTR